MTEKVSIFSDLHVQEVIAEPEVQRELWYYMHQEKPTGRTPNRSDKARAQIARYRTPVPPERSLEEIGRDCQVSQALVGRLEREMLADIYKRRAVRLLPKQ